MRRYLLTLAPIFFGLGCQNSVVEPVSSSSTTSVAASLSLPTYASGFAALATNATATLRLDFSGAASTTLTDAIGSTASPPAGITTSASGTVACSTVALIGTNTSGATVLINGCTGDGALTVGIAAGVAKDADLQGSAATAARTVLIQNTVPTATLALAQTGALAPSGPNTLTITFGTLVNNLSATNANNELTITGCATPPSPAITTATVAGHSVATVALSGATCAIGATVSITLNLNHITNLAGTAGLASANPSPATYAITATAPTLNLAGPTYPGGQSALRVGQTAGFSLTYTNANSQTLAAGTGSSTTPPGGLAVSATGSASCTTVSIVSPSTSGASFNVGGCTGDGTVQLGVAAGVATGPGGAVNTATPLQTILIYNTPPTVTGSTAPANAGGTNGSATLTYTFSSLMTALDPINSNGQFTITGCSGTNPGVSVAMSTDGANHSIATLSLSGGSCVSGETVHVDINMGLVADGAGNGGNSSYHPAQLTYVIP